MNPIKLVVVLHGVYCSNKILDLKIENFNFGRVHAEKATAKRICR